MEALTHEHERQGVVLLERRGGVGTAAQEGRGCQEVHVKRQQENKQP
jgi:hypothetical protein